MGFWDWFRPSKEKEIAKWQIKLRAAQEQLVKEKKRMDAGDEKAKESLVNVNAAIELAQNKLKKLKAA